MNDNGILAGKENETSGKPQSSNASGTRYLLGVILVATLVYLADQATKMWIVTRFSQPFTGERVNVAGEYLRLIYSANSGAVFGLFQEGTIFFTFVAIVAVPVILLAHRQLLQYGWPVQITLGLLLGGTLGNLTDRIRFGYVVDFIDAGIGGLRWYTFNIADSAFVIGVAIIFTYFFLFDKQGG
jgi:signal peptidase II